MTGTAVFQKMLVALAVLGLCLPQAAKAAAATSGPIPTVVDVALAEGGVLHGQVVDPQGVTLERVPVSVWTEDRQIAVTRTDANGYFAVRGLRGGVYQVVAANGQGTFRLWAPGSAPPMSQQGALVVGGAATIRGHLPECGALKFWLSDPWIVAGFVATAVAVPIAIHNADRPSSP